MEEERIVLKRRAAEYAVEFVRPGMVVGLGHGSTAIWALRRIAEKLDSGALSGIWGVPASTEVEQEATRLGIPLTTLETHPVIDITIDGADEIDSALNLIKGGGGALLREKIVAQASKREVIVADASKLSPALGTYWAVPVEVIPFGHSAQVAFLEGLGAKVRLRINPDGQPFMTDQKNLIYDCDFGPLQSPVEIAKRLKARTGVVEHGLFIALASDVVVADQDGIRHLKRA